MKRLLMTTTALIALGGISSAVADINISGNANWSYMSWSDDIGDPVGSGNNNTKMSEGMEIWFTASETSDSGLTYGAAMRLREGDIGADRNYIHVSDDWGKLTFGKQWAPLYSGSLGANWRGTVKGGQKPAPLAVPLDSNGNKILMTDSYITTSGKDPKVIYDSPTVSGLKVSASFTDAGAGSGADSTSWRVTYGTDVMDGTALKVSYGSEKKDAADGDDASTDQEITELGFAVTRGDLMIAAVQIDNSKDRNKPNSGSTTTSVSEQSAKEVELSYKATDALTLNYINFKSDEDGGDSYMMGDKYSSDAIGAQYMIAPGLVTSVIYTKSEYTDDDYPFDNNDATATYFQIRMTFQSLMSLSKERGALAPLFFTGSQAPMSADPTARLLSLADTHHMTSQLMNASRNPQHDLPVMNSQD